MLRQMSGMLDHFDAIVMVALLAFISAIFQFPTRCIKSFKTLLHRRTSIYLVQSDQVLFGQITSPHSRYIHFAVQLLFDEEMTPAPVVEKKDIASR